MESWKIAAYQTENSKAVSNTSIDSTKARIANFCPHFIIHNFFLKDFYKIQDWAQLKVCE